MKIEEKLKVALVILIIILISIISFGGIFIQKTKFVENIIPEYQLGMDLEGRRLVTLEVDTSTDTIIYDADGNIVTEEGEDTTTQEVPVNPEDAFTVENYNKTKEIIEKRLKSMGVSDYTIRQDENNGKLYIQIPENNDTNLICSYMAIQGVFTVINEDEEILLDNSHIKQAQVGYSTDTSGTTVYLNIQLNKEGTQIFKDITNTYVSTTDEEGNDTTKTITLKIDDSSLLNTYFESEISNGIIQMSIGATSTDNATVQSYIQEASNIAVLLNSGNLPLVYSIEENMYVMSDITEEMFYIPIIVMIIIILIGIIFLIIKYKKNGFLTSIALIGYIATLLLVLRYTNVVLTMEGIIAIIITIVLDYIFTVYLLSLIKQSKINTKSETLQLFKEALIKTLFIFIPAAVTAVVLCFAGWLPIYSFGMVIFWGLLIITLYNLIITKTLIVDTKKNK